MSQLVKAIRPKRFDVNENSKVHLIIETNFGERIKCEVRNCSLHGIGAEVSDTDAGVADLNVGDIIPESKLQWGEDEVTLGRMVLKSKYDNADGKPCLGFFCIDTKLPISGKLAGHFKQSLESVHDYELSTDKFSVKDFFEKDLSYNDIFQKCREFSLLADNFKKNPVYQYYSIKHSVDGPNVELSTAKYPDAKPYLSFSNFDYFGLTQNEKVKEAGINAIRRFGSGAGASFPVGGKTIIHEELEQEICNFLNKDACFLFNSGYITLQGSISAVAREGDLILADMLSHASIIDGCLTSRATTRFFQHNSLQSLEKMLDQYRGSHAGCLIITEGIFSMDGDMPNLREIFNLAEKYNARVLVDEVHSMGILGNRGQGSAELHGCLSKLDLYAGTLGKLLGSSGGFIAGNKDSIKWISYFARSGLFTTGLSPCSAAVALESLRVIRKSNELQKALHDNISYFHECLRGIGLVPSSHAQSPIVPVFTDTVETLSSINEKFYEAGIFVNSIVYPAVPVNKSRLRFFLTCLHKKSDLSRVVGVLDSCIKSKIIYIDDKGVLCSEGNSKSA